MKKCTVTAISLNQTPLDWHGNEERIIDALNKLQPGAQFVSFAEMAITGYGCEDWFHAPFVAERAFKILQKIAAHRAAKNRVIMIGIPVWYHNAVYNGVAVIVDQKIVGITAKMNLANDGVHYEARWFKAWEPGRVATYRGETTCPLGDLTYEINGIRFKIEICQDGWMSPPQTTLGVDIIFNLSASHFSMQKQDQRRNLVINRSREFSCAYVYTNALGNEAGRVVYDGGCMVAVCGTMLTESKRFSFTGISRLHAEIDLNTIRVSQARHANFNPLTSADHTVYLPELVDRGSLYYPKRDEESTFNAVHNIPEPLDCYEEFTSAIALALYDYIRKTKSSGGVVISLSGGLDSTVCVVVAYLAVTLSNLRDPASPLGKTEDLITCIYQGTENSSKTTRDIARETARDFGARFFEHDVDTVVNHAVAGAQRDLGYPLTWEDHDIPLQNIQARARAPYPWLIANILNALLLTTSNRSEAAVGYATMDGDTAGGLAPIAGVEKEFLRGWLRWFSELHEGRFPSLKRVLNQPPTAELRQPSKEQTDEHDLMPYPVFQQIEDMAVWGKHDPRAVYSRLRAQNIDHATARTWTERFFRLFAQNQWKRERYAPSFHLDDRNLDPRSWCRFPILNGGFRQELVELMSLNELMGD